MATRAERLAEVRKRYNEQSGRRAADPHEWKPPRINEGQEAIFKFIVLPPMEVGDKCVQGTNTTDMKGMPTYRGGTHWINNRPYECPRLHDGDECAYCRFGFDLLSETEDKDQRRQIIRSYIANEFYAINIYFPPYKNTPKELRGQVKWWKVSQKTVWSKFNECLNRNEEDAQGDTPEENKPWGFFYESDESYVFKLEITHKGEYNNYEQSEFLVSTKGPIMKDDPDGTKLQAILDKRHDLSGKFSDRDGDKLENMVNALENPEPETEASGFDDDELLEETPAAAASSDDELVEETPKTTSSDDTLIEEEPKAKSKAEPAKAKTDDEDVDALLAELSED